MATPLNILLISIDSLRFDVVRQSESKVVTPTIDALLEEGLRFDRAYANGPYTRASFPAIMTGTYPWSYGGFHRLSDDRPHLAESLSAAEYMTGGFHSNPYLSAEFGYDRGFDTFDDGTESASTIATLRRFVVKRFPRDTFLYRGLRWLYKTTEEQLGTDIGTPYRPGTETTTTAEEWLGSTNSPFFCWVHYMDPHHPYLPREGTTSENIDRKRAIRLRQQMIESPDSLTGTDVETLRTLYHGEIEYVDECLAELLSTARSTEGDTVVVFLSDHGEAFGEHGRYGHTDILYDEVTRIPLAINAPDVDGGRVSTPVSCVDILPTILDYAGLDPPDACIGSSLRSFDDPQWEDRTVFTHAKEQSVPDASVMACDGEWKLIAEATGEPTELYHLTDDPGETVNLVEDRPDVRERFADRLSTHLAAVDERSTDADDPAEISDDIQDRLEQLGYLE